MEKTIAIIRGDGIGPEIMAQALAVLDVVANKFGHTFRYEEAPMRTPAGVQSENLPSV